MEGVARYHTSIKFLGGFGVKWECFSALTQNEIKCNRVRYVTSTSDTLRKFCTSNFEIPPTNFIPIRVLTKHRIQFTSVMKCIQNNRENCEN